MADAHSKSLEILPLLRLTRTPKLQILDDDDNAGEEGSRALDDQKALNVRALGPRGGGRKQASAEGATCWGLSH